MCLAQIIPYNVFLSSIFQHIKKLADRLGVEIELVAQLRYDLSRSYKKHREESRDIEVDLLRFAHVRPGEIPRQHDMSVVLSVAAPTKDASSRTDRKNPRRGKSYRKQ